MEKNRLVFSRKFRESIFDILHNAKKEVHVNVGYQYSPMSLVHKKMLSRVNAGYGLSLSLYPGLNFVAQCNSQSPQCINDFFSSGVIKRFMVSSANPNSLVPATPTATHLPNDE